MSDNFYLIMTDETLDLVSEVAEYYGLSYDTKMVGSYWHFTIHDEPWYKLFPYMIREYKDDP